MVKPKLQLFTVTIRDECGDHRMSIRERAYSPQGAMIQVSEKLTSGDREWIRYINEEEAMKNPRTSGTNGTDAEAVQAGKDVHAETADAYMAMSPSEPMLRTEPKMPLHDALAEVINRYSIENYSNTPDFVLGSFLAMVTEAWGDTVRARDDWHGVPPGEGPSGLREKIDAERLRADKEMQYRVHLQIVILELLAHFNEHGEMHRSKAVRSGWIPVAQYAEFQKQAVMSADDWARNGVEPASHD
jgi:hypothetical protein